MTEPTDATGPAVSRMLRGKPIAERIRASVIAERAALTATADGASPPRLQVLLAGDDPGSRWYADAKAKLGAKLGIEVAIHQLSAAAPTRELIDVVVGWNRDDAVDGVLVELPLPPGVDKHAVLAAIDPLKDVDGVTPTNRGLLFAGTEAQALIPATPLACLELLAEVPVTLSGMRAVVVGRGDTVGRPVAALLLARHATVTICHSRTADLAATVASGELVIAAAGHPGLITAAMVSPGAVVVDAGITDVDGRMVGDVDAGVAAHAAALTPVPGGVGTVTTAVLMRNVLRARALRRQQERTP